MPSAANLVRRRRARWAVPALAVAAVGAVIAGSAIGGAQATPRLPARTTAQLLAAVDSAAAYLGQQQLHDSLVAAANDASLTV